MWVWDWFESSWKAPGCWRGFWETTVCKQAQTGNPGYSPWPSDVFRLMVCYVTQIQVQYLLSFSCTHWLNHGSWKCWIVKEYFGSQQFTNTIPVRDKPWRWCSATRELIVWRVGSVGNIVCHPTKGPSHLRHSIGIQLQPSLCANRQKSCPKRRNQ